MTSTTPASGATGISTSSLNITATFNEAVQSGTITFVLKDLGGNTVPSSLNYDSTTNTATFTPSATLAAGMTYTATVTGAQDLSGNLMSAPYSWTFTTGRANSFTQTTVADFSSGTQSNTMVTDAAGGELQLVSYISDDFDGTSLSGAWTSSSWASAGGGPTSVTESGGILSVAGAEVLSRQVFATGAVEGRINFGATPYQHFGMATDLGSVSGNYWAIFSTAGTSNTLYARVNNGGTTVDIGLGSLPTGFHDYRVQPVSGGFQFLVDGVAQTTISASFPFGTALHVAMSSFNGAPQPALQADWARLDSYPSSGTFVSSVLDAGQTATWGIATWDANVPTGTTLTIQTSSSADGVNWSDWSTVSNGGTITSPYSRYLRYEVLLTTTDPTVTPRLSNISFTWA